MMALATTSHSSMDSVALFKSMAKKYGAEDAWITTIDEEMHLCTFAKFFHASSYHPNKEDDLPLIKLVAEVTKTAPRDPTREAVSDFRRLCYEAWVLKLVGSYMRTRPQPMRSLNARAQAS